MGRPSQGRGQVLQPRRARLVYAFARSPRARTDGRCGPPAWPSTMSNEDKKGEEDGRRRVMHDDGSRGLGVRIPHGGAVDGAQVPLDKRTSGVTGASMTPNG